ncbi:DMT family transporter [Propylenella binzhouense]|uniref:DMT family transporter n=1 Tax=Propylenella binzhouense TaxID=2555902 RepID=A0A964T2V1_9HYPH|nr:DMT family transporter [Propylenella binzhouense]MYZ47355.1 DMT family transporter [Propylenella binzhouense]
MARAANSVMGATEWTMLVTLSILWGGSFFFNGIAVHALPPLTIVACRVALAALALQAVLALLGARRPAGPRVWAAFAAMGVLNNVLPFALIVWGQTQIASGLASILNATTPLFTVVVAHFATPDEKLTTARIAGLAAGFAGVAVMIGPDALVGLGHDLPAQLACLAAALSYACAGVFGRRFGALGLTPIGTAAGQITASAAILVPLALVADRPWQLPAPGTAVWLALAGLALVSTAFAYILYFRLLATAGATNLLLVTFLVPVSAVALGAAILGERLEPRQFAGMALIGVGLAAIDGRPFRRARAIRARGAGAAPARK